MAWTHAALGPLGLVLLACAASEQHTSGATSGGGTSLTTSQSGREGSGDTSAGIGTSVSSPETTGLDGLDESSSDTTTTTGGSSGDGTTGERRRELNALHVSEGGLDSNPGTASMPMRTIAWALGQAELDPGIDTIRVAGGSYSIDVANDASLVVVDGVSLLGGWAPDFHARDPAQWPSVVLDGSAVPPVTSDRNPARLLEVPAGVRTETMIDGFRFETGSGAYRAALVLQGNATVAGNTVVLGPAPHATNVRAIWVEGATPRISRNRIDLVGDASSIVGVSVDFGDPVIDDNVITLDMGTSANRGIDLMVASPEIVGNSIWAGEGANVSLIRLTSGSAPVIDNNLLQSDGTGSDGCVVSLGAGAVPATLRNNLLECYYPAYGNGESPWSNWTTIGELHAAVATASGNLKLGQPVVTPTNGLRLDAATVCLVARGGLDMTVQYPNDFAGLLRTDPVSIGAHEWDGDCQ